jgi:hypothetical protein
MYGFIPVPFYTGINNKTCKKESKNNVSFISIWKVLKKPNLQNRQIHRKQKLIQIQIH